MAIIEKINQALDDKGGPDVLELLFVYEGGKMIIDPSEDQAFTEQQSRLGPG